MHIYKRKNGYYYLRFLIPSGSWKNISTGSKNKRAAIEFLTKYQPKKPSLMVLNKAVSFSVFSQKYVEYSKIHHSPSNTIRIQYVIQNFNRYRANILLNEISRMNIEEYIQYRLDKIKSSTLNIELRVLKSMFNTAVNWNLIPSNPLKNIKQLRINQNIPKMFTHKEIESILDGLSPTWLKNIVTLAVNTGMRRNELINLKWADINISKQYLIIRNTQSFTTKSKAERVIPLNLNSIEMLRKIPLSGEFVFTNCNSQKIYSNYLSQCFRDRLIDLNIRNNRSFHTLRHTFASWLVQKGVSIYEVSKLLGHTDIKTTQMYAHLRSDDLRNAVERLDY
ncbi:tyrosine-type recombinase/integrase [Candidatus Woesearchaeota archaeon]|nr:tyrosine-type recombinase/integrase [Candidatus Woesearchaeota archaeon]